jgi:hypothetical protein
MDDNPTTTVNSLTAGLDDLVSYLEGSTLVVQAYTDMWGRVSLLYITSADNFWAVSSVSMRVRH